MTQAGEHNPYNPSPVYCISPPTCTLSLSLSLSLSLEPKERKKKNLDSFRPRSATAASLLEMWPLRFWSEGRKFYFRWSVSKPKLKPERGSVPPTPIPSRREAGRVGPNHHPPQRAHPSNTTDLAEDVTRTWRLQTRDVRDAIIFRGAGLGVRGVLRVVVQARGTSMRPPLLLLVRSQEYVLH